MYFNAILYNSNIFYELYLFIVRLDVDWYLVVELEPPAKEGAN